MWISVGTPGPPDQEATESKETLTHTSVFVVLFRSLPNSLADMKCSLKAGMSLSVAKQPRTDMQQLMRRGRTGTGDILDSNEPIHRCGRFPVSIQMSCLSVHQCRLPIFILLSVILLIFLQLLFVDATLHSCCSTTSDQWMAARANLSR